MSKKGVKATEDVDLLQLLFGQEELEQAVEPEAPVPELLVSTPEEPEWTAPEEPQGEKIIPMRLRATRERIKAGGWPGSCVNEDGVYIGGLGNFCPEYRPVGESMCAAHQGYPDYQLSRLIPMELRIKPRSEWPHLIVELRAKGINVSDDVLTLPKRTSLVQVPEEKDLEEAPLHQPLDEEAPRKMTMKEKQIAAKKKKSA